MSIIKRVIYKIVNYNLSIAYKYSKNSDLEERNIINLKIILNREKLLEYLPKNGIVAELGVDKGDFSEKIISISKPKKLYLIDIWATKRYNQNKMNFVRKRFGNEIKEGRVKILREHSEKALRKFDNNYFDWIYIDTSHSYLHTKKELNLCRLKVKDGGIIAGHDYCQGNINAALAYGVVQAVNEFCVNYNWEFIYLTHETQRDLSYAIRKIYKTNS